MVYSPLPVPPGVTSPSIMPVSRPMPPMGVNESYEASAEPVEVLVDATPNKAVLVSPNATCLPSVLPVEVWVRLGVCHLARGRDRRVVGVLAVAREAHPYTEDDHHGTQEGGAVAHAAHHLAEG